MSKLYDTMLPLLYNDCVKPGDSFDKNDLKTKIRLIKSDLKVCLTPIEKQYAIKIYNNVAENQSKYL